MSSSQWTSALRVFPTSGFDLLDPSLKIEEETLPTYRPEKYYPVQQGEVLNDRYQVLAKLGYGVTSTVWFGRDLVDSKYVALKIYVNGQERNHELDIYNRINPVETVHPGKRFIRRLLDHFIIRDPHGQERNHELDIYNRIHPGKRFIRRLLDHFIIRGPYGQHICLVHEPLGISAYELLRWAPAHAMTLEDLKPCIRQLLITLDFLHSVADIIYTDLRLENLLFPTPQPEALSAFEEREIKAQSARKVLKDRTIYTSSRFPLSNGPPLLSDFGEARFRSEEHQEDIMPNPYRAPEVILKSSWDYKVDIWNVAMVAWDMVSPHNLINGKNSDGIFDDRVHLAELVALLGKPPLEFRQRSHLSSVFWDDSGNWKELAPIPDRTLESLAANIRGEDKEGFLRWLRMALQWNPKDRPTVMDLLFDEWMMKGLNL